jgi:zinc D-Ala-D-Ala dipeptidase
MICIKNFFVIVLIIIFSSCKIVEGKNESNSITNNSKEKAITHIDSNTINDTTFVNLKSYNSLFAYDLKYATNDNFLKQAVYDCPECYLRLKTAKALIEANNEFISLGYKIKLFDCYRPLSIQKKMWEIVSNPNYVADPSKGSIHNRGCAIDITLVDLKGNELDMGTKFDFFGEESSHNYKKLSDKVLNNRQLLKKIMLKHNFKSFDSEWWHYNLTDGNLEKLANFNWNCN